MNPQDLEPQPIHLSKPCVVFRNKGEIDLAAVTTLGVSVKPNPGSIGYFGTGLKYSIAVALREGLEIIIRSGRYQYAFFLKDQRIRGEHFQIVHMRQFGEGSGYGDAQSLHFTTSYGRNWTLENVYRELWSNAKDEHGWVEQLPDLGYLRPFEGETQIIVVGEKFVRTHYNRYDFLLDPKRVLVSKGPGLEVYAGSGQQIFYRGIGAFKLAKPSTYTYNITSSHTLTEDRTLEGGDWNVNQLIRQWILHHGEAPLIEDVLCAPEDKHESGFHFSNLMGGGETFKSTMKDLMHRRPLEINETAVSLYFELEKTVKLDYEEVEITSEERETLDSAIERVKGWGFDYAHYGFSVKVVKFAGNNIIARVNGSECILTYAALEDLDLLEHSLIEEFIHMRDKCLDASRHMQNVLFREIVRLGRSLPPSNWIAPVEGPIEPIAGSIPPEDEIPF